MRCFNPKEVYPKGKPLLVGCNKCIACLSNKRTDWAIRIQEEHLHSHTAYFVTLTYDNKHCPRDGGLRKRHLQLFFKRLRRHADRNPELYPLPIRYYAVGEYGSKHHRPHYHIILFNAQEKEIRKSWRNDNEEPIGHIHIGKVTAASVAYTLKYVVQPKDRESHLPPPFSLMSRGYGLGGHYLSDEVCEWHRNNLITYYTKGGEKMRLPRFYRDKIFYGAEKEAVSRIMRYDAEQNEKQETERFKEQYGDNWEEYVRQMRDAYVSKFQSKIAFTQTF